VFDNDQRFSWEKVDRYRNHLTPLKSRLLKGQSHEKVGEMSVWGISLGPN
jgi:hypothetical protein